MEHIKYPVRLIFFSTEKGPKHNEILAFATALFSVEAISIHRTVKGFLEEIQAPGFHQRIVLILLGAKDELSGIIRFRDLLQDRSLILILPDSDTEIMTRGATLYPRYIGNIQDDLTDVYRVLEKMYRNMQTRMDREEN